MEPNNAEFRVSEKHISRIRLRTFVAFGVSFSAATAWCLYSVPEISIGIILSTAFMACGYLFWSDHKQAKRFRNTKYVIMENAIQRTVYGECEEIDLGQNAKVEMKKPWGSTTRFIAISSNDKSMEIAGVENEDSLYENLAAKAKTKASNRGSPTGLDFGQKIFYAYLIYVGIYATLELRSAIASNVICFFIAYFFLFKKSISKTGNISRKTEIIIPVVLVLCENIQGYLK